MKSRERHKSPRRIATSEKLARVLEAQEDPRLEFMITRAREGLYDDYKSDLPMPIHLLVDQLRQYGYNDLAKRAIDGEFDAQVWEGKEWFRKEGAALLIDDLPRSEKG